jgi:hypothetical protein
VAAISHLTPAFKVPGHPPGRTTEELDKEFNEDINLMAPDPPGKVVIKLPERNSPALFDPHFASSAGSMQMVGIEEQGKKGGFRKWVKGKLERYVGPG